MEGFEGQSLSCFSRSLQLIPVRTTQRGADTLGYGGEPCPFRILSPSKASACARIANTLGHGFKEKVYENALAFAGMLKRDFPGARSAFERATTFMPAHIGTWIGLGWCEFVTHDLDGAQAAFVQALALDRSFSERHGCLAVVLARRGQAEDARRATWRSC